ncbi:MAG TPA: PAS domain-containing protein, partial [Nevskiaceae bacterium]|nr:PAS domain-containing protein [Nevskiaceae bacterium]
MFSLFAGVIMSCYLLFWLNLRERTQAAAALAHQRIALAVAAAQLGLWESDAASGEMIVDDIAAHVHGIPGGAGTTTFKRTLQQLTPADAERVKAAAHHALATRSSYQIEYQVLWPDNTIHTVSARGQGEYDDDGRAVRMIGVAWDSTAHRREHQELRHLRDQLEMAQQITGAGTWCFDLETRECTLDPNACLIFGLPVKDRRRAYEALLAMVHPDDRERVSQAVEDAIFRQRPYAVEVRIVTASGRIRVVRSHAKVQYADAGGPALRMVGACWDVTQTRRGEAQTQAAQERMLRQDAALQIGSWSYFPQENRIQADAALVALYDLGHGDDGITLDQVLQRVHAEDRQRVIAELAQLLQAGGEQRTDYRAVWADGSVRQLHVRGIALRDGNGATTQIVGATIDVTRLYRTLDRTLHGPEAPQ